MDAASKTAEGVKNTARILDPKPANNTRSRYPRAFYGREKFYRAYMDADAEINWVLHQHKKPELRDASLISSFYVFPEENDIENTYIVALAYERVVCWDEKKKKVVWSIDPRSIEKVNIYQDGLQVDLKEPDEINKVRDY